jgi:hypothetical protein
VKRNPGKPRGSFPDFEPFTGTDLRLAQTGAARMGRPHMGFARAQPILLTATIPATKSSHAEYRWVTITPA